MRILLPPSETKHAGGDGPPLDVDALSFESLARTRTRVIKALGRLDGRPRAAAAALGLGPRQLGELALNEALLDAPTMPAIERYTGVLYDALDVTSLPAAARRRANERLVVGSALFGLLRADDAIPAYRLSAGSRLPRFGTLASVWRPAISPTLDAWGREQLVVDLRSGAYQALAPAAGAVTVRVLHERADGHRAVVSHFNKSTKGRLARLLAGSPTKCRDIDDVVGIARGAGFEVEPRSNLSFDVVTRD